MSRENTKKRRIRFLDCLIMLVFLAGICVMLYPMASDRLNRMQANRALKEYRRMVQEAAPEDHSEVLAAARDYNRRLKENPNPFSEVNKTEGYENTMRIGDSDIMGYVMIEKIRVRLPFYHGTDEEILQTSIGHLEGSSLPVGDPGEHVVLSAHRGLPSAKLFTDLPELSVGDTFVLTVLDQEMTYEVDQILTVLPESHEAFETIRPVPGEDLVTLMTCTPYGVNTHRLLVRGHRTENRAHEAAGISTENSGSENGSGNMEAGRSFDRYIPYAAAAAIVIFIVLLFLPKKKYIKEEDQ